MKLFFLLLTLIATSYAQPNTVNLILGTNLTGVFRSPTLPNIGQSSHLFRVYQHNKPTHSCINYNNLQGAFEASYDNGNTWQRIQTVLGDFNNLIPNPIQYVTGSFSAFRFSLYQFDTTNCIVDIYYSAALSPPPQLTPVLNGYINGSLLVQTGTTTSTTPFTPTAGSTLVNVSTLISFYEISIFNSSAAAETVTLSVGGGGSSCGGPIATPMTVIIPAASSYTIPLSAIPFLQTQLSIQPCLTLGSNASTHNLWASIVYRYEY